MGLGCTAISHQNLIYLTTCKNEKNKITLIPKSNENWFGIILGQAGREIKLIPVSCDFIVVEKFFALPLHKKH